MIIDQVEAGRMDIVHSSSTAEDIDAELIAHVCSESFDEFGKSLVVQCARKDLPGFVQLRPRLPDKCRIEKMDMRHNRVFGDLGNIRTHTEGVLLVCGQDTRLLQEHNARVRA